jgi:hypothetical protein
MHAALLHVSVSHETAAYLSSEQNVKACRK